MKEGRPDPKVAHSYFNLDTEFSDTFELSMEELCRVLDKEYGFTDDAKRNYMTCFNNNDAKKSDKDNKDSGIINILEQQLFLDIQLNINSDSPQELFDKLRLLKFIFDIERVKNPHQKAITSNVLNKKIPMLKYMITPRLDQCSSRFADEELNATEFQDVIDALLPYVDNAEARKEELTIIHSTWIRLIDSINNEAEKGNIDTTLLPGILQNLNRIPKIMTHPYMQQPTDGALNTFYNMMLTTTFKAELEDSLRNGYEYTEEDIPPDSLIWKYVQDPFYDTPMEWEQFLQYFSLGSKTLNISKSRAIWSLILYKEEPTFKDIKNNKSRAKFAQKYAEEIADYLKATKKKDKMSVSDWIVIVQELMCLYKRSIKYENKVVGYHDDKSSFKSVIEDPTKATPIYYMLLIYRIRNRYSFLFGAAKQIDIKRQIDHTIMDLENVVFSYYNMEDIRKAHRTLLFYAATSCTGDSEFKLIMLDLMQRINSILHQQIHSGVKLLDHNKEDLYRFTAALRRDEVFWKSPFFSQFQEDFQMISPFIPNLLAVDSSDPNSISNFLNSLNDSERSKLIEFLFNRNKHEDIEYGVITLSQKIAEYIIEISKGNNSYNNKEENSTFITFPIRFDEHYEYQCKIQIHYFGNTIKLTNFTFQ